MTLISAFYFEPQPKVSIDNSILLSTISLENISIVVPVKNDQEGINNLLDSFLQIGNFSPSEIIIVDDHSDHPVFISQKYKELKSRIEVIKSDEHGPAAARNKGWKYSTSEWILFLDSDCIATESTLSGYIKESNGSLAYAGNVRAYGRDKISKFYDNQETLIPLRSKLHLSPLYIITANCVVSRTILKKLDGFNETFREAGGEDIDLGLRIADYSEIKFVESSLVLHNYKNSTKDLWHRFFRYGKAIKKLTTIHSLHLGDIIFIGVRKVTLSNLFLGLLMNLSLNLGYLSKQNDDHKS